MILKIKNFHKKIKQAEIRVMQKCYSRLIIFFKRGSQTLFDIQSDFRAIIAGRQLNGVFLKVNQLTAVVNKSKVCTTISNTQLGITRIF